MEEKKNEPNLEKVDYERCVVRKAFSEYWRSDEKVGINPTSGNFSGWPAVQYSNVFLSFTCFGNWALLGSIDEEQHQKYRSKLEELAKMLSGLIKSVEDTQTQSEAS